MYDIDPSEVKDCFSYSPETGELRWRIGNRRRKAGEVAGCPVSLEKGRVTVGFKSRLIRAHILIWAYQTGEWPSGQIDHINQDPSDNRWCNLRLASKSENMRNVSMIKSNTSGYKGVSWSKATGKWRASIKADGQQYHLGVFDTAEEASMAYTEAALKLHGMFSPNYGQNRPSG